MIRECSLRVSLTSRFFNEIRLNNCCLSDLTDKFDHTFICGDLNFRLDVSRLHADWLISRKGEGLWFPSSPAGFLTKIFLEYQRALEFDELSRLLRTDPAFHGFAESTINFPPTFKYDILKRGHSSRSLYRHGRHRSGKKQLNRDLSEVEEKEDIQTAGEEGSDDSGDEDEGDVTSFVSSMITSFRSKDTTDVEDQDPSDEEDEALRPAAQNAIVNAGGSGGVNKILHHPAAQKAKLKWLSLISSRSTSPNPTPSESPQKGEKVPSPKKIKTQSLVLPRFIVNTPRNSSSIDAPRPVSMGGSPLLGRSTSSKTTPGTSLGKDKDKDKDKESLKKKDVEDGDDLKGVYDSSSKQRVPSWCVSISS